MWVRVGIVGLWAISWALLGWWLFDPETHITRGSTFPYHGRAAESTRTAVGLGALLGGLGGVAAVRAARHGPWWAGAVAVLVGALASGGSQAIHEWRYPVGGEPGRPPQPAWESAAMFALLGAAVGLPAGCALMAAGQAALRRERKAQPNGPSLNKT